MKRVISAIAAAVIFIGAPAVHADMHPGIQGLNDLLIEKGIITKEEVEAQAKKHSLNISGYIQFHGTVIENNHAVGAGDGKSLADEDGFRIRRAKLAASGYAYEHIKFKLEVNFAGSPSLDDAFIESDHLPYLTGKIGQFKVPFSREMLTSDTEILSIERSEVVRQIAPERDAGISFGGEFAGGILNYSVGAFNGAKAKSATTYAVGSYNDSAKNSTRNDNDKLLYAGRLTAKPIGWINVGVNGLTSKDGQVSEEEDRIAYGADLQVKVPNTGLQLQAEYIRLELDRDGADLDSDGFYIQAGYFFIPKHLEAMAKYEEYDADDDVTDQDDIEWTTVGLNYYIFGSHDAKLMANYIFKDEKEDSYDNDTFLAQFQLRF